MEDILPTANADQISGKHNIRHLDRKEERLTRRHMSGLLYSKDVSKMNLTKARTAVAVEKIESEKITNVEVRHTGGYLVQGFDLPYDRTYDYYYEDRQWFTNRLNPQISVYYYGDTVFVRNNYRIFALEKSKLKYQSSFVLNDFATSNEWLHSLNIPHINYKGLHLAGEERLLVSELDGHLIALDYNAEKFSLRWDVSLEEYRLVTAPIIAKNLIVAIQMNSKKEMWVVGYDKINGSMKWSNYLGISSFTNPPNNLSALSVNMDDLFLVTDLGLMISVSVSSGMINWKHLYRPSEYSIFDFLKNFQIQGRESTLLPNEASLLKVIDGTVLYKATTSPYFYHLDANTGKELNRVEVDNSSEKIVGHWDRHLLIAKETVSGTEIIASNLYGKKRKTLLTLNVRLGDFEGSIHANGSSFLKFAQNIIEIRKEAKAIIAENFLGPLAGDLIGSVEGTPLIKDGETIKYFSRQAELSKSISTLGLLSHDCYLIAQNFENIFSQFSLAELKVLEKKCSNESVEWQGVRLRMKNLLAELSGKSVKSAMAVSAQKANHGKLELDFTNGFFSYLLEQDIVNPVTLFMINGDELLHIDVGGNILWAKNILKERGNTARNEIKLLHFDQQKIIVIKDRLNVLAMEKATGNRLWSFSLPNVSPNDYKMSYSLGDYPMIRADDNNVILATPDRLLKINVLSGVVKNQLGIKKSSYYLYPSTPLLLIDENKEISRISTDDLSVISTAQLEQQCLLESSFGQGMVHSLTAQSFIIISESCSLLSDGNEHSFRTISRGNASYSGMSKSNKVYSWDYNQHVDFIMAPYHGASARKRVSIQGQAQQWLLPYDPQSINSVTDRPVVELANGNLILLRKTMDGVQLIYADTSKEKLVATDNLVDLKDHYFSRISNGVEYQGRVYFILSTVSTLQMKSGAHADVDAHLVQFNLKTLKLDRVERLASYSTYRYSKPVVQMVGSRLFFSVANYMIGIRDIDAQK